MDLVLGIDGGGTKTNFILTDLEGHLVNLVHGGPSSIDTISLDKAKIVFEEGVKEALKGLNNPHILSTFAGLGGVISKDDELAVEAILKEIEELKDSKIMAKSDIYNAYAAGNEEAYGIAMIIGTGIVAFSVNKETNEPVRVGGYTYKEGDFGSSYDVGHKALALVSKYMDGRLETSPLIEALVKHFDVHTFNDVKLLNEQLFERRTDVAQLAKFVTKYAEELDNNAMKILDTATTEAAMHVEAVLRRCPSARHELSITGSLGNADTYYKKMFVEKIKNIASDFIIHENIINPALGSIVIAMDNLEISKETYLKNLKEINL